MDHKYLIDKAIERLVQSELAKPRDLQGCSAKEISCVEKNLKCILPAAYGYFLRQAGQGMGEFFSGSEYSCDELEKINQQLTYSIALNRAKPFLKNVVCFLGHQGYEFLVLDCSTKVDNPPVLRFGDGLDDFEDLNLTFCAWLDQAVDDEIRNFKLLSS